MNNVELRWLVRIEWDGPKQILQYRKYIDTQAYAGFPDTNAQQAALMSWTEWTDIPTVPEIRG
jgi:hypothetical protein